MQVSLTESIGILASIIVMISFMSKDMIKVRLINGIGCILFILYGCMISSISVTLLNSVTLILQVYNLFKIWRN